ncbi:Beta-glucosidase BoGH3B [Glycine max]|nr:Beta-glucosidase BoGH3B [Glycine max]
MTLREKIGQMTQFERTVATSSAIRDLSIESLLSSGGSAPFESRLIGLIWWMAFKNQLFSCDWEYLSSMGLVQFMVIIVSIVLPYFLTILALELLELKLHCNFAPCVAVRNCNKLFQYLNNNGMAILLVLKDPRWGRCNKCYSEDTEIVRKMTSIVSGLQGQPPQGHEHGYPFVAGRNNVIACTKHFVGDGGTYKGVNEGNTILSYEDLERIHMAPYLDCISQGGFVISDWEGLDQLCEPHGSDHRYCISSAVNARIDMVMVAFRFKVFIEELAIDDAVERILRVKFAAGLFEFPLSDRSLLDIVGCKLHRDLARKAVQKSLDLLKNGKDPSKPFLPLIRNAKRMLVAGTRADDLGYQCRGWTKAWYGMSGRITDETTILDVVQATVGAETEVTYEKYPSIYTIERHEFSFAIVAVGEAPYAETWGDNSELTIPVNGADIISLVADQIPTLVILISGRRLVLEPRLLEKIDALVAAWLPGNEGEGIIDVIFCSHDFKDKLPVTWFRRVERQISQIGRHHQWRFCQGRVTWRWCRHSHKCLAFCLRGIENTSTNGELVMAPVKRETLGLQRCRVQVRVVATQKQQVSGEGRVIGYCELHKGGAIPSSDLLLSIALSLLTPHTSTFIFLFKKLGSFGS